ncbi:hypothetical protein GLOIN_2v1790442 [Rhizophagus clarus]|uniref:Uncharacterized protein n=1 Tax=Rhizophagus clarus TaxID=94130 RepID=A0A8H3M707_9GLOM|nr:hypothetical protein GLOIN_2v1790442 [Rhizophagus clarus]
MRIFLQTSRETKSEFFGKCGWTLHSVLVYQKIKLNIEMFDHWSDDTKQDAWFTASSLHAIIENLEHKPKWITIISDNGPHYHNTQLMIILSYWYDWYNIEVRRWIFLEAGEAKISIDFYYAQISQAIKCYVKFECNITDGKDIQKVIQNISGTCILQLTPDQKSGHILARTLLHINEWTTITLAKIKKLEKTSITKPNPSFTAPSKVTNQWITSILRPIYIFKNKYSEQQSENKFVSSVDLNLVDLTNKENIQRNIMWALKEKQTTNQRKMVKRIKPEIKVLMEIIFLNGNIDKRKKMITQEMYDNLTERALQGEIEESDISKVVTIQNWIANYTRTFKASASLRALEEAETLRNT